MIVVYGGFRLWWFETEFWWDEKKTNAKTDEKNGCVVDAKLPGLGGHMTRMTRL